MSGLSPARVPTFYFVGVTTAKSSIMKVFPEWARYLGLDAVIAGIDCAVHDTRERYRDVVAFLKRDPKSLGALVTTHKIDLLDAARDLFDRLDPYAKLLGEVSSISKRNGSLVGHAKDPITSGLSLEAFLPTGHWKNGASACLLGAGGSSLALSTYFMERSPGERPKRIVVTNRSEPRLAAMEAVHRQINPGIAVEYRHAVTAKENDAVVAALPAGSLVVNATGLGKDAPGSPLTDAARFPEGGVVWEFNYRGDLLFLEQARRQEKERHLSIEDGWTYFVHGWTRVIAEVFGNPIAERGAQFDELSRIAAAARG